MNLPQKLRKGGLIAAHRGSRAYFPENTMAAFMDCPGKCDYIEFDVRFTQDMVPVIFHDHTLVRTSDIQQNKNFEGHENDPLKTFTYSQLQLLDIGSWFYNTDPFQTIANNEVVAPAESEYKQTIIELDTLLDFSEKKHIGLNIELKSLHESAYQSAKKIVDAIHHFSFVEQCVVSSFDHDILRTIKHIDNHIITAALVEQYHPDNLLHYLHDLGVNGYHVDNELADSNLINTMVGENIFVGVYTVNSKKRKEELLEMGVGSVITDFLY